MISLVWFRQDFRIKDNLAIHSAIKEGEKILPIYIYDKFCSPYLVSCSKTWLHFALEDINKKLNYSLKIFSGDQLAVIESLCRENNISSIHFHRSYEHLQMKKDYDIKTFFKKLNIPVFIYDDFLLYNPKKLRKDDGSTYKVFTPFYKKFFENKYFDFPKLSEKLKINFFDKKVKNSLLIENLKLKNSGDAQKIFNKWKVGEEGASDLLKNFSEKIFSYSKSRDFPSEIATSKLSPYLHFGHITPKKIWNYFKNFSGAEDFLRQLVWREFAYYTLFYNSNMESECIDKKFENFPWENDQNIFQAWCIGKTGYPIVDAGMRELLQTGYMHNRVRMITASFLVKNLNIDWRLGQKWFLEKLIDADIANNSFGWQWIAGCGRDAAPFFRIFNPTLQSKKFDSEGIYIRRYVPEISKLPSKYIHNPSEAPQEILDFLNIKIGVDYPLPIVSFSKTRTLALQRYKHINEK